MERILLATVTVAVWALHPVPSPAQARASEDDPLRLSSTLVFEIVGCTESDEKKISERLKKILTDYNVSPILPTLVMFNLKDGSDFLRISSMLEDLSRDFEGQFSYYLVDHRIALRRMTGHDVSDLLYGPGVTQQQEDRKGVHLMEDSYALIDPLGGVSLEGHLARHGYLTSTWQNAANNVMVGRRRWHKAYSISGTFGVRLRMFTEQSNPVRTPSYLPRIDAWRLLMRRTSTSAEENHYVREPVSMIAVNAAVGHHSNGQDKCTFRFDREPDGACPRFPREWTIDDVNRESGNFSTNYGRIGVHYRRYYLDGNQIASAWWNLGLEGEFHPVGFGPGGITDEMQGLYGFFRLRVKGEFMKERLLVPWRVRIAAAYEHSPQSAAQLRSGAWNLEVSMFPWSNGDWGLFGRAFSGQDYYNLAFLDDGLRSFAIGIVWQGAWRVRFPPVRGR